MIDSTPAASGAVVDKRPAWSAQPVVEADAGRQAEEAREERLAQSGQRSRPEALQTEQVLARPEDALGALPQGSQKGTAARFVPARRPHREDAELGGGVGELATGVALVAAADGRRKADDEVLEILNGFLSAVARTALGLVGSISCCSVLK